MKQDNSVSIVNLDSIQLPLMEFINEGILIISNQLSSIYMNNKGKELYQRIQKQEQCDLPYVLKEIAYQFKKNPELSKTIVHKEHSLSDSDQSILRIRAIDLTELTIDLQNLQQNHEKPWIIFYFEDFNSILEDLRIKQEKYGLTQRETQVFQLLLQSNSYKDIASKLNIELNTVRFHVKNIYMKRRNFDH